MTATSSKQLYLSAVLCTDRTLGGRPIDAVQTVLRPYCPTKTMDTDKLSLPENTRAISSVVGVALMVGIVVVLSGVIGFAVLDFGDDIGAEPTASVNVEETTKDNFRVTWVSQGNADKVEIDSSNTLNSVGESATVDLTDGNPETVTAVIEDNPDNRSAVIYTIEP